MPLGSGALAGTTYPLDRRMVAEKLGFDSITENSLDGVSDRDFAIELAACLSILMMHLSRLCEEMVLWSSGEFSFIEMDDAYSTGSSIMPQKKNPDVAELVRGKTGRVYGSLMTLLNRYESAAAGLQQRYAGRQRGHIRRRRYGKAVPAGVHQNGGNHENKKGKTCIRRHRAVLQMPPTSPITL